MPVVVALIGLKLTPSRPSADVKITIIDEDGDSMEEGHDGNRVHLESDSDDDKPVQRRLPPPPPKKPLPTPMLDKLQVKLEREDVELEAEDVKPAVKSDEDVKPKLPIVRPSPCSAHAHRLTIAYPQVITLSDEEDEPDTAEEDDDDESPTARHSARSSPVDVKPQIPPPGLDVEVRHASCHLLARLADSCLHR